MVGAGRFELPTWSGREDLNLRPQRPERCALTRLRYAPTALIIDGITPSIKERV